MTLSIVALCVAVISLIANIITIRTARLINQRYAEYQADQEVIIRIKQGDCDDVLMDIYTSRNIPEAEERLAYYRLHYGAKQ